ncbi:MAG: DUF4127 family protein [Anaerolineaceae bacterium]|nr:DUF4127 family protein [Anaerolineaceae bacterium]
MRIGLIPLDERPVNVRYPQMIAEIAGQEIVLPPMEVLSQRRKPANRNALQSWMQSQAVDAWLVSVDMLGYGGLVTSRTSGDDVTDILANINDLRDLDDVPLYGFNVITRVSNANSNTEEAVYWGLYGTRIYRYSQLKHRQQLGHDVETELASLEADIPAEHLADFRQRRLRNHMVNLHVLKLFTEDVFDLLVISSDDTSEYGYGSQEKAWLQTWARRLADSDPRLLFYPGADEIGCVLMIRAILRGQTPPTFAIMYAIDEDRKQIAPYEDGPISTTVERQIRALGGTIMDTMSAADFVVAVNPPVRIGREYDDTLPGYTQETARRVPHIEQFVRDIDQLLHEGRHVILCDVAYPNGADPLLIERLFQQVDVTKLAAYGAWNTAGNTIGTALAQGVAASMAASREQKQAQSRFLAHRFIEDWGYQHLVRQATIQWLGERYKVTGIAPQDTDDVLMYIENGLRDRLIQIPGLGKQWRIVPGSVRLPWQRLFEVDFDLEALD